MQPKEYFKKLLRLHPFKVQMLSFLDISMCIEEHKFGFISSQIEDMSLLNNLLLCGDGTIDESEFFYDLVNELKKILKYYVIHNPWFSKNLTNFEVFEHRNKLFVHYPQGLLNVFLKNIFWDKGLVKSRVRDQLWKVYQFR